MVGKSKIILLITVAGIFSAEFKNEKYDFYTKSYLKAEKLINR